MNICVNYYGQPRGYKYIEENFNNKINDNKNNFHILYTTWNTETTEKFNEIFSNHKTYVRKIDYPDKEEYKDLIEKYTLDPTNSFKGGKEHLLNVLYIKYSSLKTIEEYEKINKINFDMVISLRPDIKICTNDLFSHYDYFMTKNDYIFGASGPQWDIYNEGSWQGICIICNRENTNKCLSDLLVIEHITLKNTNIIHPETSQFKLLKYYNLKYEYLNFEFICPSKLK